MNEFQRLQYYNMTKHINKDLYSTIVKVFSMMGALIIASFLLVLLPTGRLSVS